MKKGYDIFLKKNRISIIELTPVVQDASSRKYFRLENKDNLLIMDSKSSENNNERFISISNFLNKINNKKCIFLNTRNDRRFRTIQLIDLVYKYIQPDLFIIRGNNLKSIIKKFKF